MSEFSRKQGQEDARKGKGQHDPNKFATDKERKDYQAGWEAEKKRQEKKQ